MIKYNGRLSACFLNDMSVHQVAVTGEATMRKRRRKSENERNGRRKERRGEGWSEAANGSFCDTTGGRE